MSKKVNQKGGVGKAIAAGVGVAAVSAAAYLLFGPEGKKNRKKINGWAVKMKGEMIEKFEDMKEVTEPMYHKVVDEISAKYAKTKGVSQEEITGVVAELKKHWKALAKDTKKLVKKVSKTPAKKVSKK
jgi:gas vesicle protein